MVDFFPIEGLVLLAALDEDFPEHFAQEIVVGLFLELERLHTLEVAMENQAIFPKGLNQIVDLRHLLEATDLCVFLSFRVNLDSLPGEFAYQKIQQQIAQRLQIISSALLIALMRRYAGVASSPHQTFAALDCDVLSSLEILVPFCQSEVDDVDCLFIIPTPSHEIVGLDISVDEPLSMDLLQSGYDLDADGESGGQRKALGTELDTLYQI